VQQPVYVDRETCERVLSIERALELAEQALLWEAQGLVDYPTPRALKMRPAGRALRFHSKAVALPEVGIAGCRIVGYRAEPDGTRPDADLATRLVVLMSIDTGFPLAIVDEHYNYSLRTAASVAVAAAKLARPQTHVGIVGAGTVARAAVAAMLTALDVASLTLTSRTIARSHELAEYARSLSAVEVRVEPDVSAVLAGCDTIVTATTARAPIITGPLRPGILVCALGSNELDGAAYLSADRLLVDDWSQTEEAADIAALIRDGHPIETRFAGELSGLVAGTVDGRRNDDETIVVRTEGLASQDILFAHWAWQQSLGSVGP
jgi:ornithine cyclodeaminase/alanine dehydrogenase-like protein (mu-crystallin family)